MESFFCKILNSSMGAVVLVIIMILLRCFFHGGTKITRYALWSLVALVLILPYSPSNFLSFIYYPTKLVFNVYLMIKRFIQFISTTNIETETLKTTLNNSEIIKETASNFFQYVLNIQSAINLYIPDRLLSQISIVWICGFVLIIISYGFIGYLLTKRKINASLSINENIKICDAIDTPFVFGYLNPCIYIPSYIDSNNIPYIIAHETVHLKRRDYLWNTIAFVIVAIHWFNPFVWLAFYLFRKDIELACDEKVIRRMNQNEKKEYAKALLICSGSFQKVSSMISLEFGKRDIKERISFIMRKDKFKHIKCISDILYCLISLEIFLAIGITKNIFFL